MPTVEKDILQTSRKISAVKKIVKNKAAEVEDMVITPSAIGKTDWRTLEFAHPERTIRIGTLFSGIGAIEHAFQRLHLNHEIVFAGDIDANCKKSYFANYNFWICFMLMFE